MEAQTKEFLFSYSGEMTPSLTSEMIHRIKGKKEKGSAATMWPYEIFDEQIRSNAVSTLSLLSLARQVSGETIISAATMAILCFHVIDCIRLSSAVAIL